MLLGRVATRHCRRALFNRSARQWRRPLATEATQNAGSIEAAFQDGLRETASIAQEVNKTALETPEAQQERSAADAQAKLAAYETWQHIQRTTGHYGSEVTPHYTPQELIHDPPRPSEVTLELLLASQAHFGHSTALWNPSNSRYIFGVRSGIHIISLDHTLVHLRRAAKVVKSVAERGGLILIAGTRKGHDRFVVRAAELAGACHLFDKWTPGSITNKQRILGRCALQVVDEFDRPIPGFQDQLTEHAALRPDLVVCLNPLENHTMLYECSLAGIPTVGIIDTDADPTWVTYPIPANDDSLRTIGVIAGALGRAGQKGQVRRKEAARAGIVHYSSPSTLREPTEEELVRDVLEDPEIEDDMDAELVEEKIQTQTKDKQALRTAVQGHLSETVDEAIERSIDNENLPNFETAGGDPRVPVEYVSDADPDTRASEETSKRQARAEDRRMDESPSSQV